MTKQNATNSQGLEGLAPTMHDGVSYYAQLVREAFGTNAASLTLFGRLIGAGTSDERGVLQSALVIHQTDLDALRVLSEHGLELGRRRLAAPLVMRVDFLHASLDTFPLELLEIQDRHVTILGDDPFEPLVFEHAYVRLQCERELKTALMALRQGLLASGGRPRALDEVVSDVALGLERCFLGLAWLRECEKGASRQTWLKTVEYAITRKLDGVRFALDPDFGHGWDEFVAFYHDLEFLKEQVDAW